MIKILCKDEDGNDVEIEGDYFLGAIVTNTGENTVNYKFLDAGESSAYTKAGTIQAMMNSISDVIDADKNLQIMLEDVSIEDEE